MFWNKKQQQSTGNALDRHAATVENILLALNIDLNKARMNTSNGYGWQFQRGSALIEIYIAEQNGREYLQVLAPLIHVPTSGLLPLYRRLLELNLSLTNASLGIYQDVIYVFNERPLSGLDANEADFLISRISEYADELDNDLINEFGGRLYQQTQ